MIKPQYSLTHGVGQACMRGFTLIELLVVIFIISIVTSVALLSVSRNENRQLEAFAKELQQSVTLAEEHAMLQPSVLGLSFASESYQFVSYQPPAGPDKKQSWSPIQDQLLGKHIIPNGVELRIEVSGQKAHQQEDEEAAIQPQVVISTNGDITPFTIYVGKKGKSPRYVLKGDADGNVTSKMLS